MISLFGEVLQAMDGFFDSCPCHSNLSALEDGIGCNHSWWTRQTQLRTDCRRNPTDRKTVHCPMRGCVAPLLAAGQLDKFLGRVLEVAYGRLLTVRDSLMQDDDTLWKLLVADFNSAKAHLTIYFRMKMGCWTSLPYLLAGLAHPDVAVAQTTVAKAVLLYDNNKGVSRHPLTEKLLGPGQLRTEVYKFLAGTPLQELPDLHMMAALLMFMLAL